MEEKLRFQCDDTLHGYQAREAEGRYNAFRSGYVFQGTLATPWLPEHAQQRMQSWRAEIWRLTERTPGVFS